MTIPVNVTIQSNKQLANPENGNGETETMNRTVSGYIRSTSKGLSLVYNEERSGSSTTTVNFLGSDTVAMSTGSTGGAYMIFEKGKTHSCVFDNGMFPMELRIRTKELSSTISKSGGKLDLDYSIEIIGSRAETSHISISVSPHSDSITS